ncbi:lipo-like protein [Bosea thiooxidans]
MNAKMFAIYRILGACSGMLVRLITRPSSAYKPFTPCDPELLRRVLEPADIVLVEGNQKVSTVIKYLTQSTWSHAALYVGDMPDVNAISRSEPMLIEMDLAKGCIAVPLSKYENFTTRICRPVGLSLAEKQEVVRFMVDHLGLQYDLRNVVDLARFLHPLPFIPVRWRRRMIALGSGLPTRAICSSLIAEAFQSVHYPILPQIDHLPCHDRAVSLHSRDEILHIRHHSLYAPRDFDISPYFQIIKPVIEAGFDYRRLHWDHQNSVVVPRSGRPA